MKRAGLLICLLLLAPGLACAQAAQEEYPLGPDSSRQPGVPQGALTHFTWTTSRIFPGTTRDYWVYVPAQYSPNKPACVMVFQDGEGFIKEDGRERIPIVFDNLIAKHDMPVTIGIFINPGVLKASSPDQQDRFNRSFEYDGMGDRYARFLLEEIIPEVAKHYNLSTNPDDRAIAGLSSGGICAFTVAWNRPDAFHRVLSFIGSFTDLRGGDVYPNLIRKTEPKPLRVFLQDGSHDLNIYAGDWWMANQSMASALAYSGYDVKFVTGDKDHDMDQGGAILPDALRWLWRDYPQPIAKPAPNHIGLKNAAILDPASDWEEVALPLPSAGVIITGVFLGRSFEEMLDLLRPEVTGLTADASGHVFFSDFHGRRIVEIGANGTVSTLLIYGPGQTTASHTLAFGPDKLLYACEGDHIAAYGPNGRSHVAASKTHCQDLAVAADGSVYFTDPLTGSKHHGLWRVDSSGRKDNVLLNLWQAMAREPSIRLDVGPLIIPRPSGVHLSADQSLMLVDDPDERWVWSFQLRPDGSLAHEERFYRLETPDDSSASGATGMTVDTVGYLYVATRLGIQVCDQPGRVVAIINSPGGGPLRGITFGGDDYQELYAVAGDRLYKRHLLRKGVTPGIPVKPPLPQL